MTENGIQTTPAYGSEADLDQLRARLACEELIVEASRCADENRRVDMADLFHEDGTIEFGPVVLRGRTEIKTELARRDQDEARHTQHVVTNFAFRLDGPDRALMRSTLALYLVTRPEHATVPVSISRHEDEFARDANGRWWFVRRAATVTAGGA